MNATTQPLGKIWFKVRKYMEAPEPVTVIKSTTNRVWFHVKDMAGNPLERFESKSSEYHEYFETEAEAVAYLRQRLRQKIAYAEETIAECGRKLAALNERYGVEN